MVMAVEPRAAHGPASSPLAAALAAQLLALLPILGGTSTTERAPPSTSSSSPPPPSQLPLRVTPSWVAAELATTITVSGLEHAPGGGSHARVRIKSVDNNFVDVSYSAGGYNCLGNLSATVLNATAVTTRTVPTQNSAPATVQVSLDGGASFGNATGALRVAPLLEVAVGRRPYTAEVTGQLVLRAAGPPLLGGGGTGSGARLWVVARLPASVHAPALVDTEVSAGTTTLASFDLRALPPTVFDTLTVTATVLDGGGGGGGGAGTVANGTTIVHERVFHRVPPPRNPNVTVAAVDHTRRGIVLGRGGPPSRVEAPWLPLLLAGFFNSAFTYQSEGDDGAGLPWSVPPQEIDPLLIAGSHKASEWARKGSNVITMSHLKRPQVLLADMDAAFAAGVYVMLYIPTAGHCNGTHAMHSCAQDRQYMRGNVSLVRDHPALIAYYICDDCCQGQEYLLELAEVYRELKQLDPYTLTTGALECDEMHAFVEPHLSLDAPMRENYRPDLAFHSSDGVHGRGGEGPDGTGSDGSMRMPPMTFSVLINLADAVRQPRPKLAQTAAWLSVITAQMAHQVWYVYNHIMYARWILEDAITALNAQLLELAPSLLGPVDTVQPTVTVVGAPATQAVLRARAWRDTAFEAQAGKSLCVHVALASIAVTAPSSFELELRGLCGQRGAGVRGVGGRALAPCPAELNATHRFVDDYSVPLVQHGGGGGGGGATVHRLRDVIAPGGTSVWSIGCDGWAATMDSSNLVNDPGFEASELPLTPGFLTCREEAAYAPHTFKGKCKIEDKHAGSWGLTQSADLKDGRAAFFADSVLPHSGRKSGRVWVPSRTPLVFGMPGHTTNINGVPLTNHTEYRVSLWARSFPPGMTLAVSAGSRQMVPITPTSALGLEAVSRYNHAPGFTPDTRALNGTWQLVQVVMAPRLWPAQTSFNLVVGASVYDDVAAPGSVWIDDVAIHAS